MTLFLLNLMLALIWVLLWGSADVYTILVGLLGGYFVLWVFTRAMGPNLMRQAYGQRIIDIVRFTAYFVRLLVKSNLMLAREVLRPTLQMKPRIIRYEIGNLTDPQIVALSNAITLTPGTLVVDVSRDKRTLYVHAMFAQDRARAVAELDQLRLRMERELFRLHDASPLPRVPS